MKKANLNGRGLVGDGKEMAIKISPERRARIEALKKRMEDYFKNRTPEEKAEDDRRNKEVSDDWSVCDGDGLDKE